MRSGGRRKRNSGSKGRFPSRPAGARSVARAPRADPPPCEFCRPRLRRSSRRERSSTHSPRPRGAARSFRSPLPAAPPRREAGRPAIHRARRPLGSPLPHARQFRPGQLCEMGLHPPYAPRANPSALDVPSVPAAPPVRASRNPPRAPAPPGALRDPPSPRARPARRLAALPPRVPTSLGIVAVFSTLTSSAFLASVPFCARRRRTTSRGTGGGAPREIARRRRWGRPGAQTLRRTDFQLPPGGSPREGGGDQLLPGETRR